MSKKQIVALIVCLFFALTMWPLPALAKGGGFSGGRSSFSGGRSFTSGSGFVSGKSFGGSGRASVPAPSTGSGGKGFATPGGRSFTTPRETTPPTLYQDYKTGRKSFSPQTPSYTTGRPSYAGTWDRSSAAQQDKYPQRPPVQVYGSPPEPPYYYHNHYWSLPWWHHLLFAPQYYYTPYGYHYYAPRFLTWFILLILLLILGWLLYRAVARKYE